MFALLLCALGHSFAQQPGLIERDVRTPDGPLVGATITARCGQAMLVGLSDLSGHFTIPCSIPVDLHVTRTGFQSTVVLSADPDVPLTLRMLPEGLVQSHGPESLSQSVTVNSRTEDPLGETAKTTYTLSSEDLHTYPSPTLDDTLRQHAGFDLFRRSSSRVTNPTSQGISLRGLGSTAASRTLVLQDGAPLNDPFGAWIHWNETPADAIEEVTIVTGGGSDLYGSSALGGVIDLVPSPVARTLVDASAVAGSQDTQSYSFRADHQYVALSGETLTTAGYLILAPQFVGLVDVPANVHSESLHTEVGRRLYPAKRFFLTGNLFNEARGNGTPLTTNGTRLWRYLGGYDTPEAARIPARVRVFGSDEAYRQSFSAVAPSRASEALTRLQAVRTQELGVSADATLHNRFFALVTGADTRDLRADDKETPFSKSTPQGLVATSARQRYTGGFGEALAQRGRWSGAASLRLDFAQNLDTVQTPVSVIPNRTEAVLSPRLGVVRTLTPWLNVHATGFRAFRSPTMNELYRTGQVGQQTTLANPALRSERGTGAEAGADLTTRRAALKATYFFTEISRPVSTVSLAQTATTQTLQRENLGQIQSQGVELAATLFSQSPVNASFGYQYAHANVTSFSAQPTLVGKWIPEVPRQTATAQLRVHNSRAGVYTLALRTSGQAFDDSANTFVLRRFFSLDVAGSRAIGRGFEAYGLVQNLFNQRPDVSRTPILTLGSGVFAQAGVRLRFGTPIR